MPRNREGTFTELFHALIDVAEASFYLVEVATRPARKITGEAIREFAKAIKEIITEGAKAATKAAKTYSMELNQSAKKLEQKEK
jgi:hypothetical protein